MSMPEANVPQAGDATLREAIARIQNYFDKHVLRDGGVVRRAADVVLKAAESTLSDPFSPPPTPPGDVITVECAVMRSVFGEIFVDGRNGASAQASYEDACEQDERRGYIHIATVSVDVPKIEPVALPPVTAVK